ncbi:MAG TPA: diguanylate cyclase [Solirubrobacteraceae bacterium]|nr:diguanylate cyclase [Solirubrobacteraceae bacterium]
MTDSSRDQGLADRPSGDRLARGVWAAQSLSEVLWETLHEELADARTQLVAELAERLAEISRTVASLARADARPSLPPGVLPEAPQAPAGPHAPDPHAPEPAAQGARAARLTQAPSRRESSPPQAPTLPREPPLAPPPWESPPAGEPPRPREPRQPDAPLSVAVLVDDLAPEAPPESAPPATFEAPSEPAQPEPAPPATPVREGSKIEIRDERREVSRREEPHGEHGLAPWIVSIERRLERYEGDGLPFAALLLELAGVERLRHAELPGEVARLTGLVEAALAAELRPADSLMRESPGRYWLLAPETDTAGAKALAARLADGVRRAASHRGSPLELAVGIAVCPEDGRRAAALAAHADIALYAAHASGRPVGNTDSAPSGDVGR